MKVRDTQRRERLGPWGHKVGLGGFTRVGKAFEEVKVLNFSQKIYYSQRY